MLFSPQIIITLQGKITEYYKKQIHIINSSSLLRATCFNKCGLRNEGF